MEIKTARDAQTFVAVWVAETMPGRRCEYLNPSSDYTSAVLKQWDSVGFAAHSNGFDLADVWT